MTGRAAHWLARPGRRLWTMHNHPEGRSASPSAVLPSLLDVHMLAHPAIETVEVCTTHGLLSAATVEALERSGIIRMTCSENRRAGLPVRR